MTDPGAIIPVSSDVKGTTTTTGPTETRDSTTQATSWISTLFTFTPRQWTVFGILGLANVFRAITILIGGPFYPPEAEDRGLSSTQIGFIFGSFDFGTFLAALPLGYYVIPRLGPRKVFLISTINLGICTILFGCLGLLGKNHYNLFLYGSFIIRIIGGVGDAGTYPSAFVIFAQEIPRYVSTSIGLLEFLFGIGATGGPLILGALMDIGWSFTAVYVTVGILLLISAALVGFFLPSPETLPSSISTEILEKIEGTPDNPPWWTLLYIPTLWLIVLNLFTAAASIGFLTATLENRLEVFQLSGFQVSAVFIVSTAVYTILSPAWGYLTDRLTHSKVLIILLGSSLIFLGFCFLGQLPFLKSQPKLLATLVGLILQGVGIGGAIMSAFPHAVQSVVSSGFEDTEGTHSLLGSLYTLTFTLGNSVGPAVAGALVDLADYQRASLFILSLCLLVILMAALLFLLQRTTKNKQEHQDHLQKNQVPPSVI